MAKKNHRHRHEEPKPNHNHVHGDQSEKIRSLKELNAMLLKETSEKRILLDSLERSRDCLEEEVRRIGVSTKELEIELNVASSNCVGMEVERTVMSCFMDSWKGEIREEVGRLVTARVEEVRVCRERVGEIGRVLDGERAKAREAVGERDALVVERGELVDRVRCLTDKLEGVGEARMSLGESLEAAKRKNEKLRWEKIESERVVKGLTKEKAAVAEELVELRREVGQLRGRVKELKRVNEDIGREKKGKEDEISELEKEFVRFSEIMTSLQKEERKLQSRLLELESLLDAVLEKVKEREREIGALFKEYVTKEAEASRLKGGYASSEKKLRMVEEELEGKERSIEEVEKKRIEMEELVKCNRKEIAGLNREVADLKDTIAELESSCRDQEDKSKAVWSEVSFVRESLDGVQSEKDELDKLLAVERQNVVSMASISLETERKIKETMEELKAIQGERDGLVTEKAEAESKLNSCVEEKVMLEKRLSGAKQNIEALKAKIELDSVKFKQISFVLRKTVVSLVKENGSEENLPGEQKVAEDFQPYAIELNAIKTAFINKEYAIEDLKRQLDLLKESTARAEKEKGLWALLSSATTLVAAASVAYLSHGR